MTHDLRKELLTKWNLKKNPFTVVPPNSDEELSAIFVGRRDEMSQVIPPLTETHSNVLIYGTFGVGKTTFLRHLIYQLQNNNDQILAKYTSLVSDTPEAFVESIFSVLQEYLTEDEMENIENTVGILTRLTKALGWLRSRYSNGIIIAIDDLEKKDPNAVRRLLTETRSILDLPCGYIMAGHSLGITKDIYTSASGVFMRRIELQPLEESQLKRIAINYLNLARTEPSTNTYPIEEPVLSEVIKGSQGIPRAMNFELHLILEEAVRRDLEFISQDNFLDLRKAIRKERLTKLPLKLRTIIDVIDSHHGLSEAEPDDVLDDLGYSTMIELHSSLDKLVSDNLL